MNNMKSTKLSQGLKSLFHKEQKNAVKEIPMVAKETEAEIKAESVKLRITEIVKEIVEDKESVWVDMDLQHEGFATVAFEIRVAEDDMGRVIGKQGCTIDALRIVLKALCGRTVKPVQLIINEIE